jgi:hypothetical protein
VKAKCYVMELLMAASLSLPAFSGPAETPWEALRRLSKHRVYTVLNHDGSCASGKFVSAAENEFVLAEEKNQHKFAREAILRISAGETPDVHFAVYSARSSWSDLQALHTPPYYSDLMIITADERQFRGRLLGASARELTVFINGKQMLFSKDYVARVLLTGQKPEIEQSGPFGNVLDLRKKVISPKQLVPLYEVTLREDNSRVECSSAYRRPQ